jgi:hypothetical protein
MEWLISKNFCLETNGYNGYMLNGFLDGYCGDLEYNVQTLTIKTNDIPKLKHIYEIFTIKLKNYQSMEPNNKVTNRIKELQEKISLYSGILLIIGEKNG